MCSNFEHVSELRSKIKGKTICFDMIEDGKPVDTGKFKIKKLQASELVYVNVHQAIKCLRSNPKLRIRILIDGEQKMILKPIFLIICVRITFDCSIRDGITTLFVNGLDARKEDLFWRIRFRKQKRRTEYEKRENVPEHVRFIGQVVLEQNETTLKSDNRTCEVVEPEDDCLYLLNEIISGLNGDMGSDSEACISSTYDLLEDIDKEQPSPGQATTAQMRLNKKPSVLLEGLGKVAIIPATSINQKVVDQMANAVIGFLCGNEAPTSTLIRECLTETQRELGEYQISFLGCGFFALLFSSNEFKSQVLENGQLFINDRPLILKKWTPDFTQVPSQFLESFPIWVKLYNLNLAYWTTRNLSVISKLVGVPLFVDKFTAHIISDPRSIYKCASSSSQRCIDYARVCVEIDPYRVLPDVVHVSVNDKLIEIRVEYEWKPQPCIHSSSLNHASTSCNRAREDVYLQSQDEPVIIGELESPVQVQGNGWPSPHSSDDEIPPLISDSDECDCSVGGSGRQSIVLSIPESLNEALRDAVEVNTSTPEVGTTRLNRLLKLISLLFPSRSKHLIRSITI